MLMGMVDGNASTPFGLSFVAKAQQTASSSTMNFGTISFGTVDTTRKMLAVVGWRTTVGSTIGGLNIGGVAASEVSGATSPVSDGAGSSIWIASVPTGASGNVTATFGNTVLRAEVALYRLVGTTAAPNGGYSMTTVTSSLYSSSGLSVTPGGGAVGVGFAVSGPSTAVGINLNTDVVEAIGVNLYMAGSTSSASGPTTFSFALDIASAGSAAFTTIAP